MALSELTPALREAIELRELHELSVQETARVLGILCPSGEGPCFSRAQEIAPDVAIPMVS